MRKQADTRMECSLLPDCGFSVTTCFKLPLWFLHRDAEPLNCEAKINPPPPTCIYHVFISKQQDKSLLKCHWRVFAAGDPSHTLKSPGEETRTKKEHPSMLSLRHEEHHTRWQRRNTRLFPFSCDRVTWSWAMVGGESVSVPLILREVRSVWK